MGNADGGSEGARREGGESAKSEGGGASDALKEAGRDGNDVCASKQDVAYQRRVWRMMSAEASGASLSKPGCVGNAG